MRFAEDSSCDPGVMGDVFNEFDDEWVQFQMNNSFLIRLGCAISIQPDQSQPNPTRSKIATIFRVVRSHNSAFSRETSSFAIRFTLSYEVEVLMWLYCSLTAPPHTPTAMAS